MDWRLGLDLGTNSLGWIALTLDKAGQPGGFLAAGSRIFGGGANGAGRDAKSGASLAVARRDARAMRRRRDRFKQRQRALIKYLIADGLFPGDPDERKRLEQLDPYRLRARALDEKLEPGEIARALFHLNQRRGFQSNKKADRGKADDESGKVKTGIGNLRERIEQDEWAAGAEPESWTYGKWLHERRQSAADQNAVPHVRVRARTAAAENKDDIYDFYPGRDIVRHEFEAIMDAQARYHPTLLTREVIARLHEIVFYQRKLRPPKIGSCTLGSGEPRLAKAHPLFQQRRLLEELNALMLVRAGEVAQRLTPDERDLLLKIPPNAKAQISFDAMRKVLKTDARFNKEGENRPFILGDEIVAVMTSKKRFGTRWPHLSTSEQWEVIRRQQDIESETSDAEFRAWLIERYGLDAARAKAIASAGLPSGFGRFGMTATTQLIAALADARTPQGRSDKAPPIEPGRVVVYSEAVQAADLGHHSARGRSEGFEDEDGRPKLPYYGLALEAHIMPGTGDPSETDDALRIGRLTNPTVHIGLNQLRRVVNSLIDIYGPPKEIALELARELKLSEEEKKKVNADNNRNRQAAEMRARKLLGQDSEGVTNGEKIADDTGANRAKLKLWEELSPDVANRRCPYSGVQIGIHTLFSDSVEIDHILPFRATLDDSNANKTVCLRVANQLKASRAPYEARHSFETRLGEAGSWDAIAERASHLPGNKRWRFEPDAMDRFKDDEGFLARHLVDTQYLGRLAREYLVTLYPGTGEGTSHVWVSPGRMTEMVRRKLGLNGLLGDNNLVDVSKPKNRLDHRHHTIDAAVIAIVDRRLLKKIATASGREGLDGAEKIVIEAPWPTFRDDLRDVLRGITVSHRTDRGSIGAKPAGGDGKPRHDRTAGQLHNDTAYGFTGKVDARGNSIVVRRVNLDWFKSADKLAQVRDPVLREAMINHVAGREGKAFEAALATFPKCTDHLDCPRYHDIRHVRVIETLSVIPIRDTSGRIYKGYKGDSNYLYDVWEMPDGKWVAAVLSMFQAHQAEDRPRPHPAARRLMSLQQDDVISIEPEVGERRLMRVVKFGQNGQITLAAPNEAGDLKRRDATSNDVDPFKYSSPTAGGLKKLRARKVGVDEIGRVRDPGYLARTARRATRRQT